VREELESLWSSRDFGGDEPPPQHVTFEGEEVWAYYEFETRDGDRLRTAFERVDDGKAAQGLGFKVENGAVFGDDQVHEELLKRPVLWSDTMPHPVVEDTVVAHRPGDTVYIRVSHHWRWHDTDRADAWLGAYGFIVERSDSELVLRCNAGYSEPDFDDLVVRISINPDGPESAARLAQLRQRETLMLSRAGKRVRGKARRNWTAMGDKKLVAAIEELRRGRGAAYETCVMAGGDPDDELERALAAADARGIAP
jgi:hypothetical protein